MLKNEENNGTEETGLVTPTPGLELQLVDFMHSLMFAQLDTVGLVKSVT